jgi:L-lactate dehydrogenase complex protein LldE
LKPPPYRVDLFIQCLVDAVYPQVAESMVRVLERLGARLRYPQAQTCCGQPAFNAGYRDAARIAAKHFIQVFEAADVIVSPSGSCVHMVRHHYPELFPQTSVWYQRAREVGQKTYELTQYLVDVLGITDLGAAYAGTVTYHDSCHLLRGLGVADQPRQLLHRVRNLRLVEMAESDRCCGFGGSFAVKYPDISTALADDKLRYIRESGADTVIGCDMGCLMHLEGRARREKIPIQVRHIAQILDSPDVRSHP